jgi:hypothetical protein
MKATIFAALAAVTLGGCIAVPYEPAPYYSAPAYYYPAPAPAVGVYYGGGYRHGHRHGRRW